MSAGGGIGVNDFSRFTAFPPLATGVLVEAGGLESIPDDQVGQSIEKQQVGFEPANFVGPEGAPLAFAFDEFAAAKVRDGGLVAWGAAADVDAHHLALHPPGSGVMATAVRAGFPGHRRWVSEAAQTKRRYIRRCVRGRWAGRTPGGSVGYKCSACKAKWILEIRWRPVDGWLLCCWIRSKHKFGMARGRRYRFRGDGVMTTPAPADRRSSWARLLLAVALLFVAGSAIFVAARWVAGPSRLEAAGRQVQVGMTLTEVEAVLGPGTLVKDVPQYQGGVAVVRGDVFHRWTATELNGEEFIVGFKGGVVFDKWYHNLNYL
jgi:HAMP domain-containing protein